MRRYTIIVFISFLLLSMVLVQCKSPESQISQSKIGDNVFIPTLVVDRDLEAHQFEGKSSDKLVRVEVSGEIAIVPQWSFAIIPSLEEVWLSPKVRVVDDNAFFSCKKLAKINLSDVDTIGENCFKFSALEEVNLAKAKNIKEFAFSNCLNLKTVNFSINLKNIGDFAFSGDTALVACHIPSGEIGASAFMGCSRLKQISFDKVTSIGDAAFLECVSLTSVVIPSSIKTIGNEAFSGCTNLKEVVVRSQDTKIAENAFGKNVIITYKK